MHSKEQTRAGVSGGTGGALRVAAAAGVLLLLAVMLLVLSVFQSRRPVSSLKQNGFLAGTLSRVLYVNADSQHVIGGETGLVNPQITIYIRGVAQSVAKGPL